jgi:hypothetical protein
VQGYRSGISRDTAALYDCPTAAAAAAHVSIPATVAACVGLPTPRHYQAFLGKRRSQVARARHRGAGRGIVGGRRAAAAGPGAYMPWMLAAPFLALAVRSLTRCFVPPQAADAPGEEEQGRKAGCLISCMDSLAVPLRQKHS